jgi:hypothetical protein
MIAFRLHRRGCVFTGFAVLLALLVPVLSLQVRAADIEKCVHLRDLIRGVLKAQQTATDALGQMKPRFGCH